MLPGAATSGWYSGCGTAWDFLTCLNAVSQGHVEVLRWARENGCPWDAWTRHEAAAMLGYTDDLGNLVNDWGDPVDDDDE